MREIKFRAWDGKTATYPTLIGRYGDSFTCWHEDGFFDTEELEQFTGLHDKNGLIEVYEGDIVICTYGKWHEEPKGLTRIGKVVYDIKTCASKIAVKDSAVLVSLYDTKTKDIEVIGNIHENPELLND